MAVFTGRFTSALTHQVKSNTDKTGSEDLRNGKTRSTNRRILHLILVHASNHPQPSNVQLELNRRIGIVVGDRLVLVPHLKSGEESTITWILSSIHMGVGLTVIAIRLDYHKGILLASEKLGFSEVRSTDNGNIQRGHS